MARSARFGRRQGRGRAARSRARIGTRAACPRGHCHRTRAHWRPDQRHSAVALFAIAGCLVPNGHDRRITSSSRRRVRPSCKTLLADEDSDVRILATELTRNMSPAVATDILSRLIEKEEHPNVCGAAVEVLTEVGTPRRAAGASGMRLAFRRYAVFAVCDSHRDRPHFLA